MSNQTQKALWNTKAGHFPRFVDNAKDTLEILDFFKAQGVDFKDKVILDIGCGNGRFALELAKSAAHIYASDISESMLEALEQDAKKLGYTNITPLCSSWEELDLSLLPSFDYAFASMTPALNNAQGFYKALQSSKLGLCYVGWGRVRKAAILDEILQAHGLKLELPTGLPQVLQWLDEWHIAPPHFQYQGADFTYIAPYQKAIEDLAWHVSIHQGTQDFVPDMKLIQSYVEKYAQNGMLTYTQEREIGFIFIPRQCVKHIKECVCVQNL